jgi:hypothetical protein
MRGYGILYGEKERNMSLNEILQLILGSSGLLGVTFLIFRTGRIVEKVENLGNQLSKLDHDLKNDIKELKNDVTDIKERVSFMESFIFFSEFKAESNGSRSEAAKRMWEKRRMKGVESKAK